MNFIGKMSRKWVVPYIVILALFTEEIGKKFPLNKENETIKIGRKKYRIEELEPWDGTIFAVYLNTRKTMSSHNERDTRKEYVYDEFLSFLKSVKPLVDAGGILSSVASFDD